MALKTVGVRIKLRNGFSVLSKLEKKTINKKLYKAALTKKPMGATNLLTWNRGRMIENLLAYKFSRPMLKKIGFQHNLPTDEKM